MALSLQSSLQGHASKGIIVHVPELILHLRCQLGAQSALLTRDTGQILSLVGYPASHGFLVPALSCVRSVINARFSSQRKNISGRLELYLMS